MAKINNQAVIQKLIDELRLYPSVDAIPTELAEKILPVFQINAQEIKFEESGDWAIKTLDAGTDHKTLTVPSGKRWEIMFAFLTWTASATVRTRYPEMSIRDSSGNYIFRGLQGATYTASDIRYSNVLTGALLANVSGVTINLQLPQKIILEAGQDVFIAVGNGDGSLWGANDDTISGHVMVREIDE